jgi:hypothetical protein
MRQLFTNIGDFFRGIPQGLRNLIYYFRVVWNDRDWDHLYIEYILLAKYRKHHARMVAEDRFENQELYNKAMLICINILQRRRDDWYTEMWHDREGQYMDFDFIDSHMPGYKKLDIKRNTETGFPDRYWAEMRNSIEERDWRVYCRIVEKYHNHWWD